MPVLEATAISVVASASNAFITLWKYGSHFVDIPEEVEQFRIAIENLELSINSAKRIRDFSSSVLDEITRSEVNDTIARSESVLASISKAIEKCRVDLQIRGTVTSKNRLDWIFSGHDQFLARGITLNSCLQVLNMQIQRMDAIRSAGQAMDKAPPSYQSILPEQRLRAPSTRSRSQKLAARSSPIDLSTSLFSIQIADTKSQGSSTDQAYEQEVIDSRKVYRARINSYFNSDTSTCRTLCSSTHTAFHGDYCLCDLCAIYSRDETQLTATLGTEDGLEDCERAVPSTGTSPSVSSLPLSPIRRNKSGLI